MAKTFIITKWSRYSSVNTFKKHERRKKNQIREAADNNDI